MVRWSLSIPKKTDLTVRMFLARNGGKKGDLSRFVDEAVRSKIFEATVKKVKEQNTELDQTEIMNIVDEAVDFTRANNT